MAPGPCLKVSRIIAPAAYCFVPLADLFSWFDDFGLGSDLPRSRSSRIFRNGQLETDTTGLLLGYTEGRRGIVGHTEECGGSTTCPARTRSLGGLDYLHDTYTIVSRPSHECNDSTCLDDNHENMTTIMRTSLHDKRSSIDSTAIVFGP